MARPSFFVHPTIMSDFFRYPLLTFEDEDTLQETAKTNNSGKSVLVTEIKLREPITIKERETPINAMHKTINYVYDSKTGAGTMTGHLTFYNTESTRGKIVIQLDPEIIAKCVNVPLYTCLPGEFSIIIINEDKPNVTIHGRLGRSSGGALGGRRKTKRHHKKYRGSRKVHGRRR